MGRNTVEFDWSNRIHQLSGCQANYVLSSEVLRISKAKVISAFTFVVTSEETGNKQVYLGSWIREKRRRKSVRSSKWAEWSSLSHMEATVLSVLVERVPTDNIDLEDKQLWHESCHITEIPVRIKSADVIEKRKTWRHLSAVLPRICR